MHRFVFALALAGLAALTSNARAAPPPIEAYGSLPAIEMVSLSPSGDRYAFIAKVGDARRLYVATVENKSLAVTDVGDNKVRGLSWAGEDYVLVTIGATVNLGLDFTVNKNELYAVAVLNLKTLKTFTVFDKHHDQVGGAVFGDFGAAHTGDHWYGYFGGVTYARDKTGSYLEHTYPDLYRVDLETGALHLAARGQEDIAGWLVGSDGEPWVRSLYNQTNGAWNVSTIEHGVHPLAAGKSSLGEPRVLGRSRTPGALLLARPNNDGTVDYQDQPLDASEAKAVEDPHDMLAPLIDPVTSTWIGEIGKGDEAPVTLFDPANQAKWRGAVKAFPGYIVHLKSWSTDFNRMIVFTEGMDDSGSYWIVDIAGKSAKEIGAAYPAVTPANVGPVRMSDYTAADGRALHGVLTLPPGRAAKNLPVVVLPHGGPEARDYPGFDWWAQAFASRGYAVFQPNFRGSSGYGADFRNAGFGQWGRKMQTDISDGVQALARQGVIDPSRACIVGGSYGGYAALAGVTVQHGLYRCAVSVAGIADLAAMLDYARDQTGGVSSTTRYWKSFMGVTSAWQTELNDISPIKLAGRADAPVLLIHGKDDTVVPIGQSQAMEMALRAAGKPVQFVVMPGEDHWLSRDKTRVTMLKAAIDFVEKNNPPDP